MHKYSQMIYILIVTMTHNDWPNEVIKYMKLEGNSRDDILDKLECPAHLVTNLRFHSRAGFRDAKGVKHRWKLEKISDAEC